MKCPHCIVTVHENFRTVLIGSDKVQGWVVHCMTCPNCELMVIRLARGPGYANPQGSFCGLIGVASWTTVNPKVANRAPCPPEVPAHIAADYKESCLVLADSPKASAALSRRCLQAILREAAKVKPGDLFAEIQQVLDSGKTPSHISEGLDAVRAIGNFAAHPIKSQNTGEILPVEPGEAEWNLDVIESLFDFYFVQPGILKAKRAALDKKLGEAGKKPLR
jgi:hypothetical protein